MKWFELEVNILNWHISKRVLDNILLFRRQLYANPIFRGLFNELIGSNEPEKSLCHQFQQINYTGLTDIRYFQDEDPMEANTTKKKTHTCSEQLELLLQEALTHSYCTKRVKTICQHHEKAYLDTKQNLNMNWRKKALRMPNRLNSSHATQ